MSTANFCWRLVRLAFNATLLLTFRKHLAVYDAVDLDRANAEEEGRPDAKTMGGGVAETGRTIAAGVVNLNMDVAHESLYTEARTCRALHADCKAAEGKRSSMEL